MTSVNAGFRAKSREAGSSSLAMFNAKAETSHDWRMSELPSTYM